MASNVKKDFREIDRLISQKPTELDDWLAGLAERMNNDIKLSFGSGPGGRQYIRGAVVHVASKKGSPPNVDTGALRASMRVERKGKLSYQIVDGVNYGVFLELGTERMGHRPFVAPVFEEWRKRWPDDLKRANLWEK
jgi:hypothetical protein